jgi:hypothetical protein
MILQWNLGKSSAETDGTAVVEQNREHKKTAATTMSPTFHAKMWFAAVPDSQFGFI